MLELDGVEVWRWHAQTRTRVPIVERLDWVVRAGERWALLGPNGAGKTTLLELAGAVSFPSRGGVRVLGETMGRTDTERLREHIGLVDVRDGRRFAPALTVEQVVATGSTGTIGYFPGRFTHGGLARVEELVAALGLGRIPRRRFADCSQGERQRALIARALVPRPRLLLLDEPGAGLDLPGRETLLAAIGRLAVEEPALALVVTTHHLEELPAETTHALLLREGRTVAAGPVEQVLADAPLSGCFGLPLSVTRVEGRWSARARGPGSG